MSGAGSEPINVVVNDSVSPNIAVKLKAIAEAASLADVNIARLNANILKMDVSGINNAAKAAVDLEAAVKKVSVVNQVAGASSKVVADGVKSIGSEAKVSSRAISETLVLLRELASGRYTRIPGSLSILAQATGALQYILSPVGLLLSGVAAGIALVGVAALKGENEISLLNGQIKATGDYAGVTVSSFRALASQLAGATNTGLSKTNSVLNELAFSGKISNDNLRLLGASALDLSKMTGESADTIAKDFIKMSDGVTKYAIDFTSHYHLITAAQIDYIRQLEAVGQKEQAERALSEDIYNAIASKGQEKLGDLQRAVENTENAFSRFWEYLKSIGRDPTAVEQLNAINEKIKDVQHSLLYQNSDFNERNALLQKFYDQRKAILDVADASAKSAAEQSRVAQVQQAGIDASSRLSGEWERFTKNTNAADEAVKRFRLDLTAALAANPNDRQALADKANQAEIEARIRKSFDPNGATAAKHAESQAHWITVTNQGLEAQLNILTQKGVKDKEQEANEKLFEQAAQRKFTLYPKEIQFIKDTNAAIAAQTRVNDASKIIQNIQDQTANLSLNSDQRRIQQQLDRLDDAEFAAGKGRFSPKQLDAMRQALEIQQKINEFARVKDSGRDNAKSQADAVATQIKNLHQYEDNQAEMYRRIDEMRQKDVLTDQQAEQAKMLYQVAVNEERLQNTQDFFGNLATLQNSSNQTIAAIGKAAAIAQATIDGILAVQKALASAPPPWNYVLAAAVGIKTAANVAQIAGIKFADGGLIRGQGGPRDDRVPVQASDGEFIVNAAATRNNLALLQMINGGRVQHFASGGYVGKPQSAPSNSNYGLPKIIVQNYGTPQTYETKSVSADEMRVIARDVVSKDAPGVISGQISDPNSKVSRAMAKHTTVRPKRTGTRQ